MKIYPLINYDPKQDKMLLQVGEYRDKNSLSKGDIKIYYDNDGDLLAIEISSFLEVQGKFEQIPRILKLGGIWKGIRITEKDIAEGRKELLRRLEERW